MLEQLNIAAAAPAAAKADAVRDQQLIAQGLGPLINWAAGPGTGNPAPKAEPPNAEPQQQPMEVVVAPVCNIKPAGYSDEEEDDDDEISDHDFEYSSGDEDDCDDQ